MRVSRIFKSCKDFFYRKEGASGIEYAIAAAMVAVVLTGFVEPISESVNSIFGKVETAMSNADKVKTTGSGTGSQ